MSEKVLRWGIVSTANIGVRKVIPATQKAKRCEVVAIASRDGERAARVAGELGIPRAHGGYEALLADRADEEPTGTYRVAGKHCESGDVLIDAVALPLPRRDDVLAVPATGAYTLGMASNYNGVPRPAAVLVRDGNVRVIRRRETIDDLLGLER